MLPASAPFLLFSLLLLFLSRTFCLKLPAMSLWESRVFLKYNPSIKGSTQITAAERMSSRRPWSTNQQLRRRSLWLYPGGGGSPHGDPAVVRSRLSRNCEWCLPWTRRLLHFTSSESIWNTLPNIQGPDVIYTNITHLFFFFSFLFFLGALPAAGLQAVWNHDLSVRSPNLHSGHLSLPV